jgi:diguanylate cyclase (GGDEF)-like protein/PAS domain S-box-containing protein
MERRYAAPLWRASLGLIVTAIAAVLLIFAVWRVVWLNNEAGSTLSQLSHERAAVAYQRSLFELLRRLERFRVRTELRRNPPFTNDVRSAVDTQMRVAADLTASNGASFDVTREWAEVQRMWSQTRSLQRTYKGTALQRLTRKLDDLIYKIEDTSGIQYESNRYAQDLADIVFAKMPEAVHDAMYADLLGENAQTSGTLSIANRVHLAGLLSLMRSNVDLETDDWSAIDSSISHGLGTAKEAALYRRHSASLTTAGTHLVSALNDQVLMREHPIGDPAATRLIGRAAASAAATMHDDLSSLLDRQLALRMGYESLRNRYIYGIVLLAAVLLVGIMLLVAELTARRDRDALSKAHQESARLSAELARQKAERALRLSEAQFRAVFDGAALGIAIFDRGGHILDANAVFRNVYGDNSSGVLEEHEEDFAELMRGERDLFEFEQHVMTPGGQEAWTDSTVSLVNDDAGNPYFAICMFRDLTELKRNERRMLHDMTHDALTGLPNRALFEIKVREQFTEAKTSPQSSFAVLVVDLDRFKDINESLGREAGDFVISQVGHRLRAAIEAADVVSRLGSDEFAVLVRSLPDVLHVELIARRVLSALSKPVSLGNRSIFVTASVGIAIASGNYQRGEDVMRDADIAMRYAKGPGGRFAVFDSNMHARAEKRLQLTTDLRLALEHGEFDVLYQPIVKIGDGELIGCEALLRWNHPTEGIMFPSDFMPLAEQTGLAIPIGRFVVRTVCQQIVRWKRTTGKTLFPVNVNVSATELLEPEFETVVVGATREFSVDPHDITLEITESVVLDAGTRPNALVERLRAHGFQICIDDFGTGYSSLRYLQQFKVDAIKIDRSFVSGHDGEVASEPIVRTLMTLAEAFDVRVVAEGIETQRQRDVLRNAGCRFGQGYYYARALSADELTAMYPAVFGLTPKHASA